MIGEEIHETLAEIELLLDQLHRQQSVKACRVARLKRPELTEEDLLNPDNFNEIVSDPRFMYEDGLAAGILSAKVAIRAHLLERIAAHSL